jgi:hypothetical protein
MSAITSVERSQHPSFMTVRQYARVEEINLSTAYRRLWAGKVDGAEQFLGRWMIRDIERSKRVRDGDGAEARP